MNDYENPVLLRELFYYDPETGRLHHACNKSSNAKAGAYADSAIKADGHRACALSFNGKRKNLMAARVVWALSVGRIPPGYVIARHTGVAPEDNRLAGLYLVHADVRRAEHRRAASAALTKHSQGSSQHRSPAYNSWLAMRQRCNNPNATGYERYGGHGITVIPRWDDFTLFLADMGERPKGTTLDRIDNDKGYSKENCRWASPTEQRVNQRRCSKPTTTQLELSL